MWGGGLSMRLGNQECGGKGMVRGRGWGLRMGVGWVGFKDGLRGPRGVGVRVGLEIQGKGSVTGLEIEEWG